MGRWLYLKYPGEMSWDFSDQNRDAGTITTKELRFFAFYVFGFIFQFSLSRLHDVRKP
jgi:hypothetical protein